MNYFILFIVNIIILQLLVFGQDYQDIIEISSSTITSVTLFSTAAEINRIFNFIVLGGYHRCYT